MIIKILVTRQKDLFTADSSTYDMLFLAVTSVCLLLITFPHKIVCKRPQDFLFTPETKKEVCVNKHPGYSFAVTSDMRCMETQVKSTFAPSLHLLQECWKEITGVQPKQDDDYIEVYCRDESPYILVNMVHDCFLRSFVRDRVETMDKNRTEHSSRMDIVNGLYRTVQKYRCIDNIEFAFQHQYPESNISQFFECMNLGSNDHSRIREMPKSVEGGPTFRSERQFFQSLYELKNPVIAKEGNRVHCEAGDTNKISRNIRCLKENTEGNETSLNKCFRDITLTSPYPTSDDEIKSYLCDGDNKIPYPVALIKKVELCVNGDLESRASDET